MTLEDTTRLFDHDTICSAKSENRIICDNAIYVSYQQLNLYLCSVMKKCLWGENVRIVGQREVSSLQFRGPEAYRLFVLTLDSRQM